MKKTVICGIILLVILQTVLAILKTAGIVTLRWLWVLTPAWLLACAAALTGMYMVMKNRTDDRHRHTDKKHEPKEQ